MSLDITLKTRSRITWSLSYRSPGRTAPYPAQKAMSERAGATIAEVPGSHAIYVSNPEAVATFIEKAAQGVAR